MKGLMQTTSNWIGGGVSRWLEARKAQRMTLAMARLDHSVLSDIGFEDEGWRGYRSDRAARRASVFCTVAERAAARASRAVMRSGARVGR